VYFRDKLLYLHSRVRRTERRSAAERPVSSAKRSRNRRIIQFLIVFVATVIIVDGLVGDRGLLAMLRARQEYDQLAETIARLRAENARLREEAHRLATDPAAIEEIARRQLGLIKPGEKVFIIKDVPSPDPDKP
jgi:cell division protein FtsB